MSKTIKATIKDTPLYHDGKRYDKDDEIELSQTQYHELSIYLNQLPPELEPEPEPEPEPKTETKDKAKK